jgi:hypothetical protein
MPFLKPITKSQDWQPKHVLAENCQNMFWLPKVLVTVLFTQIPTVAAAKTCFGCQSFFWQPKVVLAVSCQLENALGHKLTQCFSTSSLCIERKSRIVQKRGWDSHHSVRCHLRNAVDTMGGGHGLVGESAPILHDPSSVINVQCTIIVVVIIVVVSIHIVVVIVVV